MEITRATHPSEKYPKNGEAKSNQKLLKTLAPHVRLSNKKIKSKNLFQRQEGRGEQVGQKRRKFILRKDLGVFIYPHKIPCQFWGFFEPFLVGENKEEKAEKK